MSIRTTIKSIQQTMWQDTGVDGDAQRLVKSSARCEFADGMRWQGAVHAGGRIRFEAARAAPAPA
jgi:hypothetical protein